LDTVPSVLTASRSWFVVLAITTVFPACGSGASPETTPATSDADSTSTVDEAAPPPSIQDAVDAFVSDAPGGVDVLIQRDGEVTRVAAGTADATGRELTTGQQFRVGSVSKTFIATMVMELVDEGRVDLDEPLGTYLPATPVGATTTVRQLLAHESGIADYTEQPAFSTTLFADPNRRFTPAQLLDTVVDEPVGTVDVFRYSNTNYILLGQLIEELDGTELNTSLERRISGPLGLTNTFFDTADPPPADDLVAGWSADRLDGQSAQPYASIATSAWAAGALVSNADDLAAFLTGLTVEGDLVSAESLTEMTDLDVESGVGLGLFGRSLSSGGPGYGHPGTIPGYTAEMAIEPATGDVLVILTNNERLPATGLAPIVVEF
jgi:D-alanyl-D-alanine carboxypeptidase